MCIDRCVAKYLEIHERIGELLYVRVVSNNAVPPRQEADRDFNG